MHRFAQNMPPSSSEAASDLKCLSQDYFEFSEDVDD